MQGVCSCPGSGNHLMQAAWHGLKISKIDPKKKKSMENNN